MKLPVFFTAAGLSVLLFNFSFAEKAASSANTETPTQPKPYEELVAALLEKQEVIPARPKMHRMAAMYNREAVIPPQCYTRNDSTYNSCYVCHQAAIPGRENVMNDDDLQAEYSFSDLGMTNHYRNLFVDRTARVAKISDEEILEYIDQDNYSELPARLREAKFKGWIPEMKDLHLGPEAFDEEGFAKDGSDWVAFNYKPFPSTFWPTNGSTDDVMIRLDPLFRETREHYKGNLAILEANMKGLSQITCLPVDEKIVKRDLNGDGELTIAKNITDVSSYLGKAEEYPMMTFLYPQGTEFMHSVRYVGFNEKGDIAPSKRMKELRYMKKWQAYQKPVYARRYQVEGFEKEAGNLPAYMDLRENGLDNGNGWSVSGFIEDKVGRLRVLTHEENFACMGCHNSIGSTIDKTFSFPRKMDGTEGWGYLNLKGMPDAPNRGEQEGEILTYLKRIGGGSEFRHNDEMTKRFFVKEGVVNEDKVAAAKDVYDLITPSRERALMMNKAYRCIVEDQTYLYGKDATVMPPKNVFKRIENETATTLPDEKQYRWNILLDWSKR